MRSISWRMKLIGLFTLILSASLLIQIFYIIPFIQDREMETAQQHQANITIGIAREVELVIYRLIESVQSIAERKVFTSMEIENQSVVLEQSVNVSSDIYSLFVMNSTGWFVSGTVENISFYQTRSYILTDFYRLPFQLNQTYFSSPNAYYNNTLISTYISVPIVSNTGEIISVIFGTMKLNDLIERISDYPLENEQVLYMVNSQGMVIAHSEINIYPPMEEKALFLNYSLLPVVQEIINDEVSGNHH